MRRMLLPALGLLAGLTLGSATPNADSIFEVENQRANARAGGPTDTELLRRWGALSGTPSYDEKEPRQRKAKRPRREERYGERRW